MRMLRMQVTCLFDEDGILVRFMNSNVEGNGIRDTVSAQNLVGQVQFNGMTPLGSALDAKVQPFPQAILHWNASVCARI